MDNGVPSALRDLVCHQSGEMLRDQPREAHGARRVLVEARDVGCYARSILLAGKLHLLPRREELVECL